MKKNQRKTDYLRFMMVYQLILLISMLLISVSVFYLVRRQQSEKQIHEMQLISEKQADYWNKQMIVISAYNTDCRYSKLYNGIYGVGYPQSWFDIRFDLKEKQVPFPFADGIYFYDPNIEKVFSSNGVTGEELFFSSQCQLSDEVFSMVDERGWGIASTWLHRGRTQGVALIYPLRELEEEKGNRYLIYTVISDQLKAQFDNQLEGGITGLSWKGKTVFSTSGDALEQLDMQKYNVVTLEMDSGVLVWNAALKDAVSSDIMLYLQSYGLIIGCSFLIGILLVYAYSRRHYVAFQNLMDYNEVLRGEQETLHQVNCLYGLLMSKAQKDGGFYHKCLECGIRIDRTSSFVAMVPVKKENERFIEWCRQMEEEQESSNAYAVDIFEDVKTFLICTDEKTETIYEKLDAYIRQGADVALGSIATDSAQIKNSYEKAMARLRGKMNPVSYPQIALKALKEAAEAADETRVELLLKEMKLAVKEMEDTEILLIVSGVASVLELETEEILRCSFEAGSPKETASALLELAMQKRKAEEIQEEVPGSEPEEVERKKNITDVLTYLHEHYLDANFTVKYMAGEFDTSISNLSHFFKKNMGVSISQYSNELKLHKAKKLLKESDMKIGEIAELLRYGNSNAFINMFKKNEGMTPKEYREKK